MALEARRQLSGEQVIRYHPMLMLMMMMMMMMMMISMISILLHTMCTP